MSHPSLILRIDDRLIHGQVIVGWGSRFPIHTYVVVDDEIAEQEWERNLLKMAVPPDKKVEILTIREGVHFITEHLQAKPMIMVLISSPFQLEAMANAGLPPMEVNVGGLHFKEGRKQYLNYLFLTEEEKNAFLRLMEKGFTFYCQDIPNNPRIDLKKVLERQSK